ncbi:MAG: hypothetical protein LC803_14570 [Acidobacteria bacterium]|nr:hypothetical protein [Acidobacteriota bacterium]
MLKDAGFGRRSHKNLKMTHDSLKAARRVRALWLVPFASGKATRAGEKKLAADVPQRRRPTFAKKRENRHAPLLTRNV